MVNIESQTEQSLTLKERDIGVEVDNKVSPKDTTPESPVIIESWKTRLFVVCLFFLLVFLMFNVNYKADKTLDYFIGAFATISFGYLMLKMVMSFFYKPATGDITEDYKVSVVIPSYNENPESVLKAIRSILEQDYQVHEIIFVDDGSKDISAYEEVSILAKEIQGSYVQAAVSGEASYRYSEYKIPRIITHRFDENKGKKQAQAWAFKRAEGDFIMLVDSDGYLYPNAVRELLKQFDDDDVSGVVGHVSARNLKDNILTKMQDILYHNAFRVGRASQSITNCVLVCSGAISMYRRNVIVDNIDEFLKTKILGIKCEAGDDRCLTNIALKYGGKTKYQSTALCITDVPTNTKNFFKQQVRWTKSFYLYTFESMKHAWKKPFMALWLLGEGFLWIFFAASQTTSFISWTENYYVTLALFSVGYMILSALMNGVYYALKNPLSYILSPFFALIHLFFLFPIRIYALITLRRSNWGTR